MRLKEATTLAGNWTVRKIACIMIMVLPINVENDIVNDAKQKIAQIGVARAATTFADVANILDGLVHFGAIRQIFLVQLIYLACERFVVEITGEAELSLKIGVTAVPVAIFITVVFGEASSVVESISYDTGIEAVAEAIICICQLIITVGILSKSAALANLLNVGLVLIKTSTQEGAIFANSEASPSAVDNTIAFVAVLV